MILKIKKKELYDQIVSIATSLDINITELLSSSEKEEVFNHIKTIIKIKQLNQLIKAVDAIDLDKYVKNTKNKIPYSLGKLYNLKLIALSGHKTLIKDILEEFKTNPTALNEYIDLNINNIINSTESDTLY